MTAVVLRMTIGSVFGLGIWLALRGALRRPMPLHLAVENFRRQPSTFGHEAVNDDWWAPLQRRIGPVGVRLFDTSGVGVRVRKRDLRIVHRTAEQHAFVKVVLIIGLPTVIVAGVGLVRLAGFNIPFLFVPPAALVAGVFGFVVPDLNLRETAEERRAAFRQAFAAYLDLTKVLVAGGSHMDGALYSAALAGEGWVFGELTKVVDRARLTGQPTWQAFQDLGDAIGVAELHELAASLELADRQGASPSEALARKAEMMIAHQIYEARSEAESATEKMSVPTVIIAFAFLIWLGAPAVAQLLDQTTGL